MFRMLVAVLVVISPSSLFAQTDESETIEFGGHTWRVNAARAVIENHMGRTALALTGGRVRSNDIEFSDGVIEFDMAFEEKTGFFGPFWRAESDDRFEEIYLRSHLSGKPDAVQYTPVENGISAWQIFSDGNAIAPITHKFDDWNNVKIVVIGDRADFYYNGEIALHIPDLKTDISSGGVGLRASGFGAPVAHYSNLTIRPLGADDAIVGEAKDDASPPDGIISNWLVSSVIAETEISDKLTLPASILEDLVWKSLHVESNGIANLARLNARLPEGGSTAFVKATITSDSHQMRELKFGYSDRVQIFLNGKLVFGGNAGWTARDYRFLGTVGFNDSVGLDLREGRNELIVAVSETFGGWAWAGAIADQSGITID